jgi:dihydrofolate reductase
MRKVFMFNQVSADGYFAARDGSLDWVVSDSEVHQDAIEGMPHADTLLFGRRTYQMFEKFWPHALDESSNVQSAHGASRQDPAIRAMAVFLNETPKLVFSRTLKDATWRNSRVISEFDPTAIAALKQEEGKDILIMGSGSIVSQLTQHCLIDEYQFVVCPILLGSGHLLIHDVTTRLRLKLIDSRTTKLGNVVTRYARA